MFIHSEDTYDKTKWNNWDINSLHLWDSLDEGFIHNQNTQMLYHTNEFEIGKAKPQVTIRMIPEINRYVGKNVTVDMGYTHLAVVAYDVVTSRFIYLKVTDLNEDFVVEAKPVEDGISDTTINVDLDFTHRYNVHHIY